MATKTRKSARAKKSVGKSRRGSRPSTAAARVFEAESSAKFRARVRMYRQGLGDCFLITLPLPQRSPLQILIDCGALDANKETMTSVVRHIRDTVRNDGGAAKSRLDVVVATHEHKDHLSGFNQAREVFDNEFEIGSVWLGWTENLTKKEVKKIKDAKRRAIAKLRAAIDAPTSRFSKETADGLDALLEFSSVDDTTGKTRIADALEYLKLRGKDAGDLRYLEPGGEPLKIGGCDDVRVYVLGPPRDPILLKGSEVTEKMKREGVVYHLTRMGEAGVDALAAAVADAPGATEDRWYPFAAEHRIPRVVCGKPNPYFVGISPFVAKMYDDLSQTWRRIDDDWLSAFEQLALDLDSDTNNTSLVLAFEFVKTGEVLLFVGDAQVGNWQSWADVKFRVPGRATMLGAHDLLGRTVFYKVGHHCSHNGTIRTGGLELMNRDDLVAFIPLDKETAAKQGKHGWDMPAAPLLKALRERAAGRVVISDVREKLSKEANEAGVVATETYIDYFVR